MLAPMTATAMVTTAMSAAVHARRRRTVLVTGVGAAAIGAPPFAGSGGADRGEQALERGGAHPAEGGGCGGAQRQPAEGEHPVQQLGEEGLEPDGADLSAGLPEHVGGERDVWPIHARPPGSGRARGGTRDPVQAAEGGLAMIPCHGHDLIEQAVLLPACGSQVPRPLGRHVLVHARPGHGHLPTGIGSGNRYF